MSFVKRQDIDPSACAEKGNEFTVCSPLATDSWYNGSTYNFVWNYNQPFYVPSKSISLYLYYKYNFAYTQIKEWTYMDTSDGEMSVQVDDTWFPDKLPAGSGNRTWTYFGYLLPADMNATKELITPSSTYPRPFNFTVNFHL
ncbi:hypothetical protein CLU79DRAFT_223112 [Phycomyces nitens]|nr:hypothetical protein CLU79DRAFT_223112 [Phycomyces nitens]